MDIEFFLQLTINGILLGAFYMTMTLGFSIIWGVMRLINLAHGEFLLVAAYLAWFFYNPTRDQDLILGGGKPEEIETTIRYLFGGGAFIVAFVVSEVILLNRFPNTWLRRILSFIGVGILAFIIYSVWKSDDYRALDFSMMTIVMVSLALSLGFVLSHIVLKEVLFQLKQPENSLLVRWGRRVAGYGLGAVIAFLIHYQWEAGGFKPVDPFIALPMILVIFFALGYVLQKTLFNRLVEGPYLTMLLVTFALKIILQNLGLRIYTANPRLLTVDYALENWSIGDLTFSKIRVYILLLGTVTVVSLLAFLNRTRVGYAIRAAAQHKMAARLMGINIKETYAITFGIAMAITAVAGSMLGTFKPITPVIGDPYTLRAFSIVALGGLGRVQGVVVGGLVLGLVESYIGGYWSTGWAITASFGILVLMLLIRPQGLAGGLQPEDS